MNAILPHRTLATVVSLLGWRVSRLAAALDAFSCKGTYYIWNNEIKCVILQNKIEKL